MCSIWNEFRIHATFSTVLGLGYHCITMQLSFIVTNEFSVFVLIINGVVGCSLSHIRVTGNLV